MPADSGISGPTAIKSIPLEKHNSSMVSKSEGSPRYVEQTPDIITLPGKQWTASDSEPKDNFQAIACSRAPDPTTSTLIDVHHRYSYSTHASITNI